MRYIVIGLGIFGDNLARDLTDMGNEVIGADKCQNRVDDIKDYISTVYLIDSTEETSLSVLPLTNVDVVVVAIGEDFGASIRTVALLKKAGVQHIYARATDAIHQAILEGFGIERIITPEQRAAYDLTHEMELGPGIVSMPVDSQRIIVSFAATPYFIGRPYSRFNFGEDYDLHLIAVARPTEKENFLGISRSTLVPVDFSADGADCLEGDMLTVMGTRKAIKAFYTKTI